MTKIRTRTLNKMCSRGERAVRRRLVDAAGRRESPDEFYNLRDAKSAIEWGISLPRSFRVHKNRTFVDRGYVHPKKIVKVRFCGYWQIVTKPKEMAEPVTAAELSEAPRNDPLCFCDRSKSEDILDRYDVDQGNSSVYVLEHSERIAWSTVNYQQFKRRNG